MIFFSYRVEKGACSQPLTKAGQILKKARQVLKKAGQIFGFVNYNLNSFINFKLPQGGHLPN